MPLQLAGHADVTPTGNQATRDGHLGRLTLQTLGSRIVLRALVSLSKHAVSINNERRPA